MQMLVDWHQFYYHASVPWPQLETAQIDWEYGVREIEYWLNKNVGSRLTYWAWNDSQLTYNIGVAFRQEHDRLLFVMTWS